MDVKTWLAGLLVDHGHLPRKRVIALAHLRGVPEISVERAARQIGVLAHRYGRESDWYPPGTESAEVPTSTDSDPEIWLIAELVGDEPVFRADVYKRAANSGFGVKSISRAAYVLDVEERNQTMHGRTGLTWSLPITTQEAIAAWQARRSVLVPLGE